MVVSSKRRKTAFLYGMPVFQFHLISDYRLSREPFFGVTVTPNLLLAYRHTVHTFSKNHGEVVFNTINVTAGSSASRRSRPLANDVRYFSQANVFQLLQ